MPSPRETVLQFCDHASRDREGLREAIRRWFTPATVWVNTGLAETTGPDEAIALVDELERTMGIASIRIELLAIAETGGKVLTERIDVMLDARGNELSRGPVMGIFEIADGRIAAWREYFDSAKAVARDG